MNRAPVMTAWAMVVAERLGFRREEALSIGESGLKRSAHNITANVHHPASAYTEMNAITKGVSLGIFEKDKADKIELTKEESQPYVDIMGRRCVYRHTLSYHRQFTTRS